jgi:hypothetical protein
VKPTPNTAGYLEAVLAAYVGEFQGMALFTELGALVGKDPGKRTKLAALVDLERRTAEELSPLVARYGLGPVDYPAAEAAGREWAIRAESWDGMIQMLLAELPEYVADYEGLLDAAPVADRPILEFLVAHERALERFVELESKGQNDDSLVDVRRLLMNVPQ